MASFDYLIKKTIKDSTFDDKHYKRFNKSLNEVVLNKEFTLSGPEDNKILLIKGNAFVINKNNELLFSKNFEKILSPENKKELANLFGNKVLIKEAFKFNKKERVREIQEYYNNTIDECKSLYSQADTGGLIRAKKGDLVEQLSQLICKLAVDELNDEYGQYRVCKIVKQSAEVKHKQTTTLSYSMEVDRVVTIDGNVVGHIESKSYADLSMYKRTLFDAFLIEKHNSNITCFLFELEKGTNDESVSRNVLDSHFPDVTLKKIALFDSLRSSSREIHTDDYKKDLTEGIIEKAVLFFKENLRYLFEEK